MGDRPGIERRDFLLLRFDADREAIELSCERFVMKYMDARANGTAAELFARLSQELRGVRELRLVEAEWLGHEEFAGELERILSTFREGGGRVLPVRSGKHG